jgi:hypothetical protein
MTTEQLRDYCVKLADKGLDSWALRRMLGENGVRLLKAMRTFWHRAGTDDLERLNGYYEAEPLTRTIEVAPQVYRCDRVQANEALLVPVGGPDYAYVSLVGVAVPGMARPGKFYTLNLEEVLAAATPDGAGAWLIYGKESPDDPAGLLFRYDSPGVDQAFIDGELERLRADGVTELRVEREPAKGEI